jgi:hypothetical protein
MGGISKIVLVTRRTRLEELCLRMGTRGQAKFYIDHAGGDFGEYEREDAAYRQALGALSRSLDLGLPVQTVERSFLPSFLFGELDVVVTIGPDGLVANTAKYALGRPIVAVNPDPDRIDGILLPFAPAQARAEVQRVLEGKERCREVTLAEVALQDGQRLLAFNDFFVGAASHVSARYRIAFEGRTESQSSSGVLVATGAGSTGWLSSVFNMTAGVAALAGGAGGEPIRLPWEDRRLVFVVREPFASKHSRASLIAGMVAPDEELCIESQMPSGGVIFSDGVESDFLAFGAGMTARIRAAAEQARLVVP